MDTTRHLLVRVIIPMIIVLFGFVVFIVWTMVINHANKIIFEGPNHARASLVYPLCDRAYVLTQINSSTYNLAQNLGLSNDKYLRSISKIETKISPKLLSTFSTMKGISLVSYIGHDRVFFSYYRQGNQTYAIFSTKRQLSNVCNDTFCFYVQPVDMDTGVKYGNTISYCLVGSNILKWIHNSLDGKNTYAVRGLGFDKFQEALFLFSAPVEDVGVVSIGIVVKDFIKLATNIDLSHSNDGMQKAACSWEDYFYFHLIGLESEYYYASLETFETYLVSFITAYSFKDCGCIFKKMDTITSLFSILLLVNFVVSIIMAMIFKKTKVEEMQLRDALIKQKEEIQQIERKSMNKSMAFASASHDMRTSLISITCMVELCRTMVPPQSCLDDNLLQMNACALKLLDILNSILDTSKLEAGKMILEEKEFNIIHVIQESLDSFNVAAMSKGLEIIWDPNDFSIFKYCHVKGDRRRFSRILDNLLGNALKFTSQGHISLLAFAKKPTFEKDNIVSRHRFSLSQLFCKHKDSRLVSSTSNSIQNDATYIEFIFEVNDTGIGIPKEKRTSVFENYVQVEDSHLNGHDGTGLGLGIVQSYVHLMGGEIGISDKNQGENGTCFRFNIFLKSCEMHIEENSILNGSQKRNLSHLPSLLDHIGFQSSASMMTFFENIRLDNVNILLLIQGDEMQKVAKRWLEGFGLKAWEISDPYFLKFVLQKIEHKLINFGSLGTSNLGLPGISSSKSTSKDSGGELDISHEDKTLPVAEKDLTKTTIIKKSVPFVVVLVDSNFENNSEIFLVLKKFSQNIQNVQYKFVLLANIKAYLAELSKDKEGHYDLILKRPLYGTHLCPLLSFFQETTQSQQIESRTLPKTQDVEDFDKGSVHSKGKEFHKSEQKNFNLKDINKDINLLNGLNILLVEDTAIISHYEFVLLSKLGAKVEICKNGLEALDKVKTAFLEKAKATDPSQPQKDLDHFPYDIILMDCEMPIMDGYQATRQIRIEENQYGFHIPIIALSAHGTQEEEEEKAILAGMDTYLEKPLNEDKLITAISNFASSSEP